MEERGQVLIGEGVPMREKSSTNSIQMHARLQQDWESYAQSTF